MIFLCLYDIFKRTPYTNSGHELVDEFKIKVSNYHRSIINNILSNSGNLMIEIYGEKWILKRRRQKRKLNGYN